MASYSSARRLRSQMKKTGGKTVKPKAKPRTVSIGKSRGKAAAMRRAGATSPVKAKTPTRRAPPRRIRTAEEQRAARARKKTVSEIVESAAKPKPKPAPKPKAKKKSSKKKSEYKVYKKSSKEAKSFRSAFRAARKAGKKVFTWQGRKYTTKLA